MRTNSLLVILFLTIVITESFATNFTVINTNDAGAGSLRQAIIDANADVNGPHTIGFAIGTGAQTIDLQTALLWFNQEIDLDGSTQPGYAGTPLITINAANAVTGMGFWQATGGAIQNVRLTGFNTGIQADQSTNISVNGCVIENTNGIGILVVNNSNNTSITNNTVNGCTSNAIQFTGGAGHVASGNTVHSGNANGFGVFNSATATIGPDNVVYNCAANGIDVNTTSSATIFGNIIGLREDGVTADGNVSNGIAIINATSYRIGGAGADSSNTISANQSNGIYILNTNNGVILGNKLGLSEDGTIDKGNRNNGIDLRTVAGTQIGTPAAGNTISGNGDNGVNVFEGSNLTFYNNIIGLTTAGDDTINNMFHGIQLTDNTSNVIIGDVGIGFRNTISANGYHGVWMTANPSNIVVRGNYVGTDITGTLSLGNHHNGVSSNSCNNVTIDQNVISGNGYNPYAVGDPNGPYYSGLGFGTGTSNITVTGNLIGTDAAGTAAVPNSNFGAWFYQSTGITFGATGTLGRNIVSGNGAGVNPVNRATETYPTDNGGRGLYIFEAQGNVSIINSYFGTDITGALSLPNGGDGALIIDGQGTTTIGGSAAASNVFSGNTHSGLHLFGNNSLTVSHNYIGTSPDGNTAVGNGAYGLYVNGQSNATISNNNISSNSSTGMVLFGSDDNNVTNNTIGQFSNGSAAGNIQGGLVIEVSSRNMISNNTITGSTTSSADGDGFGVFVGGSTALQNTISENSIFCNLGLAIDLSIDASKLGVDGPGNTGKSAPYIDPANSTSISTSGTGIAGETIELFSNPSACGCDAEVFIGSTTVLPDGSWSISHPSVTDTNLIAATATENGNTSVISCKKAIAGSFTLNSIDICETSSVSLEVQGFDGNFLIWQYATDAAFTNIIAQDTSSATGITAQGSLPQIGGGQFFVRVISVIDNNEQAISGTATVNIDALPVYDSITVDPSTICNGESAISEIHGSSGSLQWYSAEGSGAFSPITNGTTSQLSVTPSITSSYTVELVNGLCSSSSDTVQVQVNPIVNPTVSITTDTLTLCEGREAEIYSTVVDAGTGATLQWQRNGNSIGSGQDTLILSDLVDGETISLEVTTDTTCAPATISTSSNLTFSIISNETPSVSVAGDDTICAGEVATFTATASQGDLAWHVNGNPSSGTSSTESFSGLLDGDTILTIISPSSSCVTASSDSAIVIVTAHAVPQPSATISADTLRACAGVDITVTLNASDVGQNSNTLWYLNGTNLNNASSTLLLAGINDQDSLVVKMSTDTLCAQDSIESNSLVFEILDNISPTLDLSGDSVICQGVDASFTATSSAGNLSWAINGQVQTETTSSVVFSGISDGDTVTVQLTSSDICTTSESLTSMITVDASTSLIPQISIDVDTNDVCEGTSQVFTASHSSAGSSPTITWLINGLVSGSSGSTFNPTGLSDGSIVSATLTTTEACANPKIVSSNDIPVIINSAVIPTVSIASSNPAPCDASCFVVEVNASSGEGLDPAWEWSINGVTETSTGDSIEFCDLAQGDYVISLELTSSERCANTVASTDLSITIQGSSTPTADLVVIDNNACLATGSEMEFQISHTAPVSSITSIVWYINDQEVAGENQLMALLAVEDGDEVEALVVSDAECITEDTLLTNTMTANLSRPVVASTPADQAYTASTEVDLDGTGSTPNAEYLWQKMTLVDTTVIGNQLIDNDLADEAYQRYLLTVSNEFCSDTASFLVSIQFDVIIPNVFSPNNDDTHDKWVIKNLNNFPDKNLEVYNRWGSLIYTSTKGEIYDETSAWDGSFNGKDLPMATYYYILDLNNGSDAMAGSVTILR